MKILVAVTVMLIVALLFPPLSALSQSPAFDPTAETPDIDSAVPTDLDELFGYLKRGDYKKFDAKESSQHPTRGPHTDLGWPVRVFLDPIVNDSMEAGNDSHPMGSSIVKEMYNDKDELQGWAVMVKTQDESSSGKGWFWYETTNTKDKNDIVAAGNGVPLCQGCHIVGKDYVLTTYPLQ